MRTRTISFGILRASTLLAATLWASPVVADVNPSYTLVNDYPHAATQNSGASPSFTLDEGHLTKTQKPLAGTSFQLIPPGGSVPVSSSSTSSSSAFSSASSTDGSDSSSRGGSRGDDAGTVTSSSSSITATSSSSSSAPAPHAAAPEAAPSETVSVDAPSVPVLTERAPLSVTIADKVLCSDDDLQPVSFFGATAHICPYRIGSVTKEAANDFFALYALLNILALLCVGLCAHIATEQLGGGMVRAILRAVGYISHMLGIIVIALVFAGVVHAAQTTPQKHVYNGRLLDAAGTPVTTSTSIRFSYWNTVDFVDGDTTATGAIHTGSAGYAGWNETHTVTPNASGYFSVVLGSASALPDFASMPTQTLLSLYLQVEAKAAVAADTAYELLDPDPTDTAIDRSGVLSVPFAENANMIDQRQIGTGSGSIPLLGPSGALPIAAGAAGTNAGNFIIDADDTETSEIALVFGESLGKKLTYDLVNTVFRFNDDVEIQGNLVVTGLINGVDINQIQAATSALNAFSGGGLNLQVSSGSYRLSGTAVDYDGGTIVLTPSTINYVFFGSGGLTKTTLGFPTDESYIAIAEVETSAGGITVVRDRRQLSVDDRERDRTLTFTPSFEKAAYQGDGADNVGQLTVLHDNITLKNFYAWSSTRETLQDYDILLRIPVTEDFVRFQAGTVNPLTLMYRSTSANAADNKLDIQIYDTNGVPVTLSGAATGLSSTSWSTAQIEFTGTPTWTPGQDMLIRLKAYAKDTFQIHIGTLKLNITEMLGQ